MPKVADEVAIFCAVTPVHEASVDERAARVVEKPFGC
jgi:hypothetical protein